jgi:FtsP/CotA-like multicopper oxidase with cupredoxin domain
MDGVPGISQPLVPAAGGRFRYTFTAGQDGTFLYHSHGSEALVNSGLYGAIVVEPAHPRSVERGLSHDYLQVLSSWQIGSSTENHFTINGKSYPETVPLEVARGERIRIRWVNISAENFHTMHTHGHYQQVIARDAAPLDHDDVEDTVLLGPGQRADVVVDADADPGNWMMHCHVLDHTEDRNGLPDGLISEIHYRGTPLTLRAMHDEMARQMRDAMLANAPPVAEPAPPPRKPWRRGWLLIAAGCGLGILAYFLARARR